ncbi:MAG TPA: hypothetical protein VF692_05910 [Pyrinomonadaceae bacterium]|jgi:hypothetical protein
MIHSLKIIREVYGIWNNPAYQRLDPKRVVEALNRVWSQRKLDLGLSGGSFLAQVSQSFSIDSSRSIRVRDSGADISDSFTEARVERRSSSSTKEEDWEEVLTGTFSDWSSFRSLSKPYAAFYGSADNPQMIVNHDPGKFVYRLFYEPVGALSGMDFLSGNIDLPVLFQALLTYDTAIEAGMLIDDNSAEFAARVNTRTKLLTARQVDALARFERWLSSRKPQSATTRTAFNERREQGGIRSETTGSGYKFSID